MKSVTKCALTIGIAAAAGITYACCCVAERAVLFGDQTNIIVWDAANKVEHFMRVANFETDAKDFSFIAPSPSIPDIGESDSEAAMLLARLSPPFKTETDGVAAGSHTDSVKGEVDVIQVVKAAGFEITTLKSDDSAALAKYLKDNNFKTSPGIEKWIKHYTDKKWFLNAFKFVAAKGETKTKMARMSFKTDQPFNPFYVPVENRKDPGSQEVFFIADKNVAGAVGDGSVEYPQSDWANSVGVAAEELNRLLKLPNHKIKSGSVVTHFNSNFPSNASDDVFFKDDEFQYVGWRFEELRADEHRKTVVYPILWSASGLIFFGAIFYFWRKAKLGMR